MIGVTGEIFLLVYILRFLMARLTTGETFSLSVLRFLMARLSTGEIFSLECFKIFNGPFNNR